jgi:hypothetical protein
LQFRQKVPVFIFGVSVGLLAGCLFFLFKLDTYIRNFNLSLLNQKQNISEQVITPKKEEGNNESKDKNTYKAKVEVKKESNTSSKNVSLISMNDITDSSYVNSENYQVLKEELISVKNLYVKTLTPEEKTSSADSLAASLAGVTNPPKEEFFMIEFWKTPLNSKGYKMTRSRLLIYGYPEKTDLALVKRDDNYYLRNNKMIYRLSYSSEFKPMERSSESDVAGMFH